MFPIALNLQTVPVILAGQGELLEKRLAYLDEDGAKHLRVFSDNPSAYLREAAAGRLVERLPTASDMESASVILIAGLPRAQAEQLAKLARGKGRLVNVEDVNDLCDFYFTANLRRGDLIVAVSTSGASPTLARKVRDHIAGLFGYEWEGRVRELANLRLSLKAKGASMREVMDATEARLKEKGWLADKDEAA